MRNDGSSPTRSNKEGDVVLVLDAGSETGFGIARELLSAGCRVAVTGRHTTALTRILHGYGSSQVMAIAADTSDPTQVGRLISRVESRFGPIDSVVRAGSADRTLDSRQPQSRILRMVTDDTSRTRHLQTLRSLGSCPPSGIAS